MDANTSNALQAIIERELTARFGDDESAMAEYIVVMLQNGKDANGINAELSDLVTNYDPAFTDWVFQQLAQLKDPKVEAKSVDTNHGEDFMEDVNDAEAALEQGRNSSNAGHKRHTAARGTPYGVRQNGKSHNDSHSGSRNQRQGGAGPMRTTKLQGQMNKMLSANGLPEMPPLPGFPSPAEFFGTLPLAERLGNQKQRAPSRRCSKWPTCFKGKACTFGHPSSICQNPDCRRKDGTCVNIHADEDIDLASGMETQRRTEEEIDAKARTKNKRRRPEPDVMMEDTNVKPICKFGEACTNRACHYAHPSPASVNGSSIVLSSETCPAAIDCHDQNCSLSHPSPSNKYVPGVKLNQALSTPGQIESQCKFYPCLNPQCRFLHDQGQKNAPSFNVNGGTRNRVWTPQQPNTTSDRAFAAGQAEEQFSATSNVHANELESEK